MGSNTRCNKFFEYGKSAEAWINNNPIIFMLLMTGLAAMVYFLTFSHGHISLETADWGSFGGYVGGVTGPVISLMALFFLRKTYDEQLNIVKITEASNKMALEGFKTQNFDSGFSVGINMVENKINALLYAKVIVKNDSVEFSEKFNNFDFERDVLEEILDLTKYFSSNIHTLIDAAVALNDYIKSECSYLSEPVKEVIEKHNSGIALTVANKKKLYEDMYKSIFTPKLLIVMNCANHSKYVPNLDFDKILNDGMLSGVYGAAIEETHLTIQKFCNYSR